MEPIYESATARRQLRERTMEVTVITTSTQCMLFVNHPRGVVLGTHEDLSFPTE